MKKILLIFLAIGLASCKPGPTKAEVELMIMKSENKIIDKLELENNLLKAELKLYIQRNR